MENSKCPVCRNTFPVYLRNTDNGRVFPWTEILAKSDHMVPVDSGYVTDIQEGHLKNINCPTCGRYIMSDITAALLQNQRDTSKDYILSGIIKNTSTEVVPFKFDKYKISSSDEINDFIDTIARDFYTPKTVPEKADHLLLYLNEQTVYGGQYIFLPGNDYAIAYCKNSTEFKFLKDYLIEAGYIKLESAGRGYVLTFSGIKRIEELTSTIPSGDQCFVAMSFADDLDEAYDEGIYKAVDEAKYNVIRVDREEHNKKIDDKIISDIRRSNLLVADVTKHRQGVYFEAGFAMGLGIPVIWTCQKKDIKKAHFDTRQYNHIVWNNPEDLYAKLLVRINALYPIEKY